MLIRVEEYQRADGSSPFRDWFDRLPAQAAAKVATYLLRVEHGNTGAIKWFSGIGEIRIDWGPGYRVYLIRDGESLIVLLALRDQGEPVQGHRTGVGIARRIQGAQESYEGARRRKEVNHGHHS